MIAGSNGNHGQAPKAANDPNTNSDVVVPDMPGDTVGCLSWAAAPQGSKLLAAGSWDNSVSVWEVQGQPGATDVQVASRMRYHHEAPVLCCSFSRDGQALASGGCDNTVRMRNLQTQQDLVLGKHALPVKELAVIDDMDLVVSGSWDKTLCFWSAKQPTPVATLQLPERVYAMDVKFPILVVGCAERHVQVYNLQNLQQKPDPVWQGFSALRHQTRAVSVFPDRAGYALGSIEGRCSIAYFEDTSKNFTFKCHRTNDTVHAVNSVDFHPALGTFATASNDGTFVFWDKEKQQRLKQFKSCHYPITTGKFDPTGNLFAYAVSYDWSRGHEPYETAMPRQILLHRCSKAETVPRPASTAGTGAAG
eukprot:CAMPEP_0179254478 /NCGR_PEP_ID=MMETSP0797-20121207/23259_1 /TAXON_ID=47934 /ORGANISM="Dinophysis acuminata, Strain DAEP01" /LENGTH=362 /DNA_ID=CAMNT_0020962357 /DNA_START=69 /DNA_END=1153 /DNA_ORIENTATION=+